ncbi:Geranylgeranyl transferase type-2 subunit alpha [Phytophthora citrophthora]|uniref:Geranylgeranyl transferase type-2 subunit alpha n=1 Tax=Phytophthora citrophthora TaxID=4793 RepID=A0AAD9GQ81_9STRA|nr:Geranylgeranyl transferase type-2 subunit alpha [Phytophthora citrophthora]
MYFTMHGRVKSVEREKEQQKTDEQRQEELSKVRMYHEVAGKVLEMKHQKLYEPSVLPLTSHLLLLNPEFHVVWSYRRQVIDALVQKAEDPETEQQELAQTELKLTLDALQRNPKSYSAWFQRQWIIDRGLGDLKKEIGLCNKLLDLDERNFHCWNYRRHVCKLAGMSEEDQLSFTTQKIEQNFSNYSALHHRTISLPDPLTADVLFDEIGLVQQAVFTEPDDQSAWFYYRWLVTSMVELVESSIEDATGFLKSQVQWLDELLEMESEAKWVIITLADLHSRLGSMDVEDSKKQSIDLYDRAIAVDPDHRRYYADMQKKSI